jgi:hypothetical protein
MDAREDLHWTRFATQPCPLKKRVAEQSYWFDAEE